MGKRLQTKFSDVNHRILKKSKRDRFQNERVPANLKRKSTTDLEEPLQKISKAQITESETEKCQDTWYYERRKEITNENIYAIGLNKTKDLVLNVEENIPRDLFCGDELKSSYPNFVSKDFYFHILDEISLEGLDGITIEGFWKRFSIALDGLPTISQEIKNFIFQNVITCSNHFQIFELPVARIELEIYNRFDYMKTDIGVVLELAYELPDAYPTKLINDASVLGSCSTFHDRINISSEVVNLTIGEAEEKYGRKLVIVADQNLRTYSLCGDLVDPLIEFLNTEYSILERIGRSRKLGELTQGRMSLGSAFKMDPKTVFHYKKQLHRSDLISKQFFVIKSPVLDQNKTGNLLHLKRFYTNIRSRQSVTAELIINLLKMQPDYRMETKKLRMMYANNINTVGKLLKNPEFRKFVKSKTYPYRMFYPNAKRIEYMGKNTKAEKMISCYELVNPYVNASAYWRNADIDESDEEDDEKEGELSGQMIYNMDSLRNIYYHIHSCGNQGYSAQDIEKLTGFDSNTIRVVLRKLVARGIVNCCKVDEGKQRKYRYTSKCVIKTEKLRVLHELDDEPKTSSVKAKILERQRAAIAKKKQGIADKPKTQETTNASVSNFLKVEKPPSSFYSFLINEFEPTNKPEWFFSPIRSDEINLIKKYKINLPFLPLNTDQLFDIDELLKEIRPCLRKPTVKENFDNFYMKKYGNKCMDTTILLFRALLGEVTINRELFDSEPKQEPQTLPDLTRQSQGLSQLDQWKMEYMGDKPVKVFSEIENNVTIEIFSSTTPAKIRLDKKYPKSNKIVTERVYKRLQNVLDLVNDMKVIEEMNQLLKLVSSSELNDGYDKKIDRKSLCRIVKRLVDEGYVKVYKLTLFNNAINKTNVFICHPSISHTHDVIQTICQQLKWKHFTSVALKSTSPYVPGVQKTLEDKIGKSPFSQADVMNSISEMKQLSKLMMKEINRRLNPRIGRVYGVKPKFTKMRIMHEFLFYVIYNFTGFHNPLIQSDTEQLFKRYRIELSDTDLNELPRVYSNEISWKMFVPPLPIHTGWPDGWALMCDIILRLPVSVLLKIHNCNFEDTELMDILNHPVKRFYLVKDLPERIRKTILFKRKYLFTTYDTINRLVFCGLIQFGPQKYKEKDQVFIYLNRRASLYNTTSSAPGYNEIQAKEYPRHQFYFGTQKDVEEYWQMMNSISLNTKLNAREPGKLVTLTFMNSKTEIVQCIKSRTHEEALLHDNGEIPGDKKGACGLDSSLWCHLVRNWFWTSKGGSNPVSAYSGLTSETLNEVPSRTIAFKELRSSVSTKFFLPPRVKKKPVKKLQKKAVQEKNRCSIRLNKLTRTIKKRVSTVIRKEYLDEIDKKILKKRGFERTKWSNAEDQLIKLCKVADIILCCSKTYWKQIVPFTVVRDVLHRASPASKYKTSRAIQRRWKKIQKDSYTDLVNQVSNLFKLKPLRDTFGILMNKCRRLDENTGKPFRLTETQISSAFVFLMAYIIPNKKKILDALQGNLVNNDHLSEDNLKYTEETAVEIDRKEKKYHDPTNEVDIKKDIVKSIIHSSLCSKGISKMSHHLLRIYQNYSDSLIKEAVKELRDSDIVIYRTRKHKIAKISDTPFSLSQYYVFLQYSILNSHTAEEAHNTFINIIKHQGKDIKGTEMAVQHKRYGQLLGVNEFYSYHPGIEFIFYFPKNTIKLNPEIDNYDELVNELAMRYHLKLKYLHDGNETEIDFETEQDDYRSKNDDRELISFDEEKQTVDQSKSTQSDIQDTPLDFAVDSGNSETISRLKTWITDCMSTESERRSPSPEFMNRSTDLIKNELDTPNFGSTHERESEGVHSGTRETGGKPIGHIPTLDEIKEGMLKITENNEERTIPYITDLSDLIREHSDLKRNYFITEFASLENVTVNEYENLQDDYMVRYLDNSMRNKNIWEKIERDVIVKDFLTLPDFKELIRKIGGKDGDIKLALDIVEYAEAKGYFGIKGTELRDEFLKREKTCALTQLIKCLLEAGLLLQVGVVTLTFVHYKYQNEWLVQQDFLASEMPSDVPEVEFQRTNKVSVRIMPWVRITGCVDKSTLKNWLSNILSYSLDYPKVKFGKLCEKYCYLKPVDLFYLLQILEELGCIELLIYDIKENTLFSDWAFPEERPATFLDNLEDIVIQPHNVSMTCLGSFFHEQPETAE